MSVRRPSHRGEGIYRRAFQRYRRSRPGMIGLVVLMSMVILVLAGHLLSPYEYQEHHLRDRVIDMSGPVNLPFFHLGR